MKNISKSGFTIIELLVVVSIIAILAVIAVVNFDNAKLKSRDAQRKADLIRMASALESYRVDNKVYPTSNSTPPTAFDPSSCTVGGTIVTGAKCMDLSSLGVAIPVDPTNDATHKYIYISDLAKLQFKLVAQSEGLKAGDGGNCSVTVVQQKAGDFCDPQDITKFQVSSSDTFAGTYKI